MAVRNGQSTIKIQAIELKRKTERHRLRLPKKDQNKEKAMNNFHAKHTQVFEVKDVNEPKKLAKKVRQTWGFGRFCLLVWDKFRKNRRFRTNFRCSTYNCRFFQANKCKKSILARKKRGVNCLKNRKHHPNWRKIVVIDIVPRSDMKPDFESKEVIDYDFKIHPRENRLYRLWFWNRKDL